MDSQRAAGQKRRGSAPRKCGLGALALGQLAHGMAPATVAPKAKRVIYLVQNGAPTHVDLLDCRPRLHEMHGKPGPEEYLGGKRFSTMLDGQTSRAMLGELPDFARHGESGATVSSFLPRTASMRGCPRSHEL